MLPGELVAGADIAHQVFRHHRRAAFGVHVLEMRHAEILHGARPGAEQPVRMRDRVPEHARRDRERHLKAVADVVLAVRRHRHVGGDDEGVVAGRCHAIDQRLDPLRQAGEIGLIPRGLIGGAHVFQRDQRRGAENHRHVFGLCRLRQHDVAAIGAQRRRAHRRNAERRGIGLAEQRGGLVAAGDVVEHARHEAVFVEGLAVVAQRGVGLGAAGDIAVEEFRNPAPRGRLEIVEREIFLQGARHRALGAGHGRGRRGQASGFVEHVGRSIFLVVVRRQVSAGAAVRQISGRPC